MYATLKKQTKYTTAAIVTHSNTPLLRIQTNTYLDTNKQLNKHTTAAIVTHSNTPLLRIQTNTLVFSDL